MNEKVINTTPTTSAQASETCPVCGAEKYLTIPVGVQYFCGTAVDLYGDVHQHERCSAHAAIARKIFDRLDTDIRDRCGLKQEWDATSRDVMQNELKPAWLNIITQELRPLVDKIRELEAWKDSAKTVERDWDPNALAAMLGGPLGEAQRKTIQREVPKLIGRVKQMAAAIDAAWSLIVDVSGGDWSKQTRMWRAAVSNWRNENGPDLHNINTMEV